MQYQDTTCSTMNTTYIITMIQKLPINCEFLESTCRQNIQDQNIYARREHNAINLDNIKLKVQIIENESRQKGRRADILICHRERSGNTV